MGARARPFGCLCPGPERLGLRDSLRSNSPRPHIEFGTGTQPRPQAPSRGAMEWRAYKEGGDGNSGTGLGSVSYVLNEYIGLTRLRAMRRITAELRERRSSHFASR